MPVKASDDDPDKARRFRDAALPLSRRCLYAGALPASQRQRRRGRGAGMLSARLASISTAIADRRSSRGCSPSCAMSAMPNSRGAPPRRPADRGLADERRADAALARSRRKRRKRNCCASGTPTPIRRLVAALAEPFRETFVLREINNLSYREIADVAGAPSAR